jgi:hypothetical protein
VGLVKIFSLNKAGPVITPAETGFKLTPLKGLIASTVGAAKNQLNIFIPRIKENAVM